MGEIPTLLLLLRGVDFILIFGVWGDSETFAVTFSPLAVFFSTQRTLSYGDDEAV